MIRTLFQDLSSGLKIGAFNYIDLAKFQFEKSCIRQSFHSKCQCLADQKQYSSGFTQSQLYTGQELHESCLDVCDPLVHICKAFLFPFKSVTHMEEKLKRSLILLYSTDYQVDFSMHLSKQLQLFLILIVFAALTDAFH